MDGHVGYFQDFAIIKFEIMQVEASYPMFRLQLLEKNPPFY